MCRQDPTLSQSQYEDEPYPHPAIQIWIWCRQYAKAGEKLLPEPEKGVLDQDADLMLAFEVLDEIAEDLENEKTARERAHQLASEHTW